MLCVGEDSFKPIDEGIGVTAGYQLPSTFHFVWHLNWA